MHPSQQRYRSHTDPVVRWGFLCACAALAILMTLSGYYEGSDDVMRLVGVRDLLAGQGWFDTYQHRLGPDEGTLMHWSRLVDAPIAGLYVALRAVLPAETALQITAFVWPASLAALTLWAFAVTGGVLGRREGAISALVIGVLTLEHSRKFDYFSFDHHNLQILLFAAALAFFVLRKERRYAAWMLGVCLALSVSVGTESILQIALIAVFCAIDWICNGASARHRTISFGVALVFTLALTSLATTGRDGFLYPSCDALTLSVALPATAAALGLLAAAWIGSGWSMPGRFGACLGVGIMTLAVAFAFAPHCLSNPIDALPQDMRDYWLSQVAEAQNISVVLERHRGEALALMAMSMLTMGAALAFAVKSRAGLDYTLFLVLIVLGFFVFLYQTRMMTFLSVSLVAVQAQILRVLYCSYAQDRRVITGLAMVAFVICASPKAGISLERQIGSLSGPAYSATAAAVGQDTSDTGASCRAPQAYAALQDLPSGMILVDFDFAAHVLRYTDHSVLGGNYHRNQAGILAQIDLFRSNASEIAPRLGALGVDYIMLCASAPRAEFWAWASGSKGLQTRLVEGEVPNYLSSIPGAPSDAFRMFKVTAEK
ncbi:MULTISPECIES: hypothetical protein [unclassified Ruegeria]|uniref:hypothetical protein n=1 Tax=unclassified Ruegeria TaxID=2625375 RepID=UPI0014912B7F|nr:MULTISPECIES: hypothetical protein [unclassified Ruegeria]NOD35284.1 hypothetical protein [Ruegeria sp. HKCCD7296]